MIAQNARIGGKVNVSFVQMYGYFKPVLVVENGDGKFRQIQKFYFVKPIEENAEVWDSVSRFYAYLNIEY